MTGHKDILGIWIGENESASFWLGVCNDLKNRGLEDILIACKDGLAGFSEAISTVFPQAEIQLCIIHQIRNSMKYVSYTSDKGTSDKGTGLLTLAFLDFGCVNNPVPLSPVRVCQ